jgi:hypothetical protein
MLSLKPPITACGDDPRGVQGKSIEREVIKNHAGFMIFGMIGRIVLWEWYIKTNRGYRVMAFLVLETEENDHGPVRD